MAYDPTQPFAMGGPGGMMNGDLNPYFASVDQQQAAIRARQQAALMAQQQQAQGPASQTTAQQAPPQQLPYSGPGDLGDFSPPPAPPPAPEAAPQPRQETQYNGLEMAPSSVTDPIGAIRDRYTLAAPPKPPAQLPYSGPSDPGAFSALDYMEPRGDQRKSGRLTQEQLDAQYALTAPGESGGNPNAVNKITGAAGTTQFTPSTLKSFLDSPDGKGLTREDYLKSPDVQRKAFDWLTQQNASSINASTGTDATPASLIAAHTLGAGGAASLMGKPGENALEAYGKDHGGLGAATTALITNNPGWGIAAGDNSATALTKIGNYYTTRAAQQGTPPASSVAGNGTPAAPSVSPMVTPVASQADPQAQGGDPKGLPPSLPGSGPGNYPPQPEDPNTTGAYQPLTFADRMMKAGGAIAQGRTLADGIGAGMQSYVDSGQQDQLNRFRISQEAANTQLLKQRLGLVDAQTGATLAKPGQVDRGLDIKQQTAEAQAAIGKARLQVQQDRVQLGQDNLAAVQNGSKAYGQQVGKDNEATQVAINNDTSGAGEDLQNIADLRKIVTENPNVVGGTAQAQVARFFASKFGLDFGVDPTANSIADKLTAASQNAGALAGAKGIGGRITQQELKQFSAGVANTNTQPEAYKALLDTYQGIAQRRLDISQHLAELRKDPEAFQKALSPANGGLSSWRQQQIDGQLQGRGITTSGAATPQYQPNAAGKWQHTDPGSGLGFTVH